MRKLPMFLAAAAAVAYAPAVSAADVLPGNPDAIPGTFFNVSGNPFSGPVSATFGRSGLGMGSFTDRFLFTLGDPLGGLGSGSLTTILAGSLGGATDLDFTSVTFDNGTTVFNVPTGPGMSFGSETGALSNIMITPGVQNILSISYFSRGAGSYGGNLSFAPSAIPEPTTWALMLMGFAGLGLVIRRRKQKARVSYAF